MNVFVFCQNKLPKPTMRYRSEEIRGRFLDYGTSKFTNLQTLSKNTD